VHRQGPGTLQLLPQFATAFKLKVIEPGMERNLARRNWQRAQRDPWQLQVNQIADALTGAYFDLAGKPRAQGVRRELRVGRQHKTRAFQQLASAKSVEQAVEIQSQYVKKAFEAHIAEMTKLGEMYASLAQNAFKPMAR